MEKQLPSYRSALEADPFAKPVDPVTSTPVEQNPIGATDPQLGVQQGDWLIDDATYTMYNTQTGEVRSR